MPHDDADTRLEPDPVIEAYKRDVDRGLLRENLKLTPWERLVKLENVVDSFDQLRGIARRRKDGTAAAR